MTWQTSVSTIASNVSVQRLFILNKKNSVGSFAVLYAKSTTNRQTERETAITYNIMTNAL